MQNLDFDIQSIKAAKSRLRQTFDLHPATSVIPITWLSMKGDEGTSYMIRVGVQENVTKVKEYREWVVSYFYRAKVKEGREFLVVVNEVDNTTLCDENKSED
jgi:hypothetical protein